MEILSLTSLGHIVATFILMPLMNISIKTGVAIVGLPFLLISIIKLILDIKKFILQKGNKQRERLILYIIIDILAFLLLLANFIVIQYVLIRDRGKGVELT